MKGPQALFFGKNSPAGVVAFTSASPTDKFQFGGSVGYELRADELIGNAFISGPIGESGLKGRVAVSVRNMKGYVYNDARALVTTQAPPYDMLPGGDPRSGEREYSGRVTLAYDNGGPFTATLKAVGNVYKDDGAVYPLELVYCGGNFPKNFNSLFGIPHSEPVGDCKPNWRTASTNPPAAVARNMLHGLREKGDQYSDIKTAITSLNLAYKFDNDITLNSDDRLLPVR